MSIPPWLQEHCNRLIANDASLTNLNLNIRRLNSSEMQALAVALSLNFELVVLNLTSSLTSNSLESIQTIASHPTLKVLHLSYNRLGTAMSLSGSHLVELHLDHNALVNPQALFKSLRKNKFLQVLHLKCNRLTDEACPELAAALAENATLRVLGLRRNSITREGATLLENTLQTSNFTIVKLDLEENHEDVSVEQLTRINVWCQANRLGRQWWHSPTIHVALWPEMMARLTRQPDVLRLFLKVRPDVCRFVVVGRKRNRLDIRLNE